MPARSGLFQVQRLPVQVLQDLISGPDRVHVADLAFDIRNEVAYRAERAAPSTWQEAWNVAAGATANRLGELRFTVTMTCAKCNGRRYDPHSFRPCHDCFGRGKSRQQVRFLCRYVDVPTVEGPMSNGSDA